MKKKIPEERTIKECRKFIEETARKYLKHLLIDYIKISFIYNKKQNTEHYKKSLFIITYNATYRRAIFEFFPAAIETYEAKDLNTLREGIIHELCHIHTIPLAEFGQERFISQEEIIKEAERLTDTLAQYVEELLTLKKEYN